MGRGQEDERGGRTDCCEDGQLVPGANLVLACEIARPKEPCRCLGNWIALTSCSTPSKTPWDWRCRTKACRSASTPESATRARAAASDHGNRAPHSGSLAGAVEQLMGQASRFELDAKQAEEVLAEVASAVDQWRAVAVS